MGFVDPIWIGCDHGSYELKQQILNFLDSRSLTVHDVGCRSTEIRRYLHFAAARRVRIAEPLSPDLCAKPLGAR